MAKEFEIAIHTVMRDLDLMRDRLQLALECATRRNGF